MSTLRNEDERDGVIEAYRPWLMSRPDLMAVARAELTGKDLVCWCTPRACHADVLLEIANSED